jgi:molybdate/tungstate transport system ATP-binding protein
MIEIKGLTAHVGDFHLKDLSLTVQDKEYFVILGPSGAGKTVFMECLAGIHKTHKGTIRVDQTDITYLSPEERDVGYVPQDYVLFPFLNVRENITFGIKHRRYSALEVQQRLMTLADLLGITHLLDRDTRSLSGGEKQRVSLARALAPTPKILLLDEPLSNLDVQTSKYLRLELRRIHKEMGVTTIHITHNNAEAEELADHIAVMCAGRFEQVGKPQDIFFSPENATVSNFIGSLNVLDCEYIHQLVPGLVEVQCNGLHIVIPHDEGEIRKIAISPRDVYVSDVLPAGSSVNRYKGTVSDIEYNATTAKITLKMGSATIQAEMPCDLAKEMSITMGKEVYVILKLRRLKVLRNQESLNPQQFEWYYQEIL